MNHSLGLAIESLVAVLLVVTIGYCVLLNARLKRLKADEHSLKAVIAELITATEIAERAIGGLKHTVRDVNENLGSQLAPRRTCRSSCAGSLSKATTWSAGCPRSPSPPVLVRRRRGGSSGRRAPDACIRAGQGFRRQGSGGRSAGILRT